MKKAMKHLMRYESFSSQQRADELLDKIGKHGVASLTDMEKEFLDAHKTGGQEEIHQKLIKHESERKFEDDGGHFEFELESIDKMGEETYYWGTLTCPDYEYGDGQIVPGRLHGRIVAFEDGMVMPDFSFEDPENGLYLEVYDFCEGLEYELDGFLDYVASELDQEQQNNK